MGHVRRMGLRGWGLVALMGWGVGCGGAQEGPGEDRMDENPATSAPVQPAPPEQAQGAPPPQEALPVPPPAIPEAPATPPWSQRQGGPQDDTGTSVAVDAEGQVIWAWVSTPREDKDREPVEGQRRAITLSRSTADGKTVWSHEFPRNHVSELRVGVAGDGTSYLSGNAFLYAVDFGLGAADDGFLVHFSEKGTPLWQRRVGQKVHGLASDATGDALVSGEDWTAQAHVPLLTRYAADGSIRWTRQFEEAGEGSEPGPVALTPSGSAVFAGTFSDVLEVDGRGFGVKGARSLVILQFNPGGGLSWGQDLPGVDGHLSDVAVMPDGSVVATGEALGPVSWGESKLPSAGPFVLAADAQGRPRWLRRPACDDAFSPPSVAVAPGGTVVAACGSRLSLYGADGAPRGERTLQPENCTEGACTVTSTAVAPTVGGQWVVTGSQRHGVTTEGWNQDAFLRLVAP
ncbi:hypothetical protein POL68_31800 [Stigmatella sp. ncwal1]|uniref:PQQ-like domain-containing protein n=1 Tax=Stigmatella ashevillensis TaxID=2995309 RepID=A0ABT5DIW2_9BACT|nr:hypothetical protein [Stigmatella ashevillena]MDC0713090.1 hypothetical protein [Stigmatella ashevillena]